MIVIMKENAREEAAAAVIGRLESCGLIAWRSDGERRTLIGAVGDAGRIDAEMLRAMDGVEDVRRISEPFPRCGRHAHPADTVTAVGDAAFGGGHFAMIAGPCAVESREQILALAPVLKAAGAQLLRGGAFKPRTSPYAFQGYGAQALAWLAEAGAAAGLPTVSEILSPEQLPLFEHIDMLQIGARNMQNYELLKAVSGAGKPVLLKRSPAGTVRELLLAAEYLMAGGCEQIVLCERGIRSFETATRNTLDLSAVPVLKEKTHLPVIVDPSHATGCARFVPPMALAAAAAGADGLMVEVHPEPAMALSDGPQALTPAQFEKLGAAVGRVRRALEAEA